MLRTQSKVAGKTGLLRGQGARQRGYPRKYCRRGSSNTLHSFTARQLRRLGQRQRLDRSRVNTKLLQRLAGIVPTFAIPRAIHARDWLRVRSFLLLHRRSFQPSAHLLQACPKPTTLPRNPQQPAPAPSSASSRVQPSSRTLKLLRGINDPTGITGVTSIVTRFTSGQECA